MVGTVEFSGEIVVFNCIVLFRFPGAVTFKGTFLVVFTSEPFVVEWFVIFVGKVLFDELLGLEWFNI